MPRKKDQDHPELFDVLEVRKLWQTEGLFSDHYLKVRLSKNDWWPADDTVRPVWEFCRDLYERRAFALRRFDNEMGTRQEFIDKILARLGFAWSDNLRLPETNQDMEPDYLLYENEEVTSTDCCSCSMLRDAVSCLWSPLPGVTRGNSRSSA